MDTPHNDIFALILESQHADQARLTGALEKRDTFPADWSGGQSEGRLAVDVFDAGDMIVVLAPMAGADPRHVDVYLHEDMLSIRGKRMHHESDTPSERMYHSECYWGPFSRSIVLPVDVVPGGAEAEFKHGLLTVRIPKTREHQVARSIPIEIIEE
jgi:HSP20 family protein